MLCSLANSKIKSQKLKTWFNRFNLFNDFLTSPTTHLHMADGAKAVIL